jgi:protease-4
MRTIGKVLIVTLALFGLLSLLISVGVVFAIKHFSTFAQTENAVALPKHFVLWVDLDQAFPESISDPLDAAFHPQSRTLQQAVAAIDQAANDPSVTGLVAEMSGNSRGMADTQELRNAVARFRAAGKPTLLFSPSLGSSGNGTIAAYMASAFETVWLQPSGGVEMTGFGVEVPFARDALHDIGIEADYGRRWEYKTALDSAISQTMSEPHRASLTRLLESWRDQVADGLSQRPAIDHDQALRLLAGPPLLAQEAVEAGLIDQIGYWDQAKLDISARAKATELVSLGSYELTPTTSTNPDIPQIAFIQADGTIQRQSSDALNNSGSDSDTLAAAIKDARMAPETRAIVLRINSPGGSYIASDTLWREVYLAREQGLPVVVSMGSMAASGGYFIALPASKIVAQPGTITGSIGVFGFKPVLAGLWQNLGIDWEQVSLNPYASMDSSNQPFTDAQRAVFEKGLDAAYGDFTKKVASGRNMDMEMVDKVARGRIWTGLDAHKVGLVDALGGLDEALAVTKQEIGLERDAEISLQVYPEPQTPLEALMEAFNLGDFSKAAQTLNRLNTLAQPLNQAITQARVSAQGPALLAPPMGQ